MKKKKKAINNLGDLIVANLKTKEIIKSIKRQNGSLLGKDAAKTIDKILDIEFGNKRSEKIQQTIIDFVIDFSDSFCEELSRF